MKVDVVADRQKAILLVETAKITLERLKESNIEKYPTNSLTDYYGIIRKLMEALAALDGVKFKGDGAHQEVIDYVCKKYILSESVRIFVQGLREYRNRISYEGFFIKADYIKGNSERIEKVINILFNLLNGKLR